jgi:membrane protease YdiL (CAAX protease family)
VQGFPRFLLGATAFLIAGALFFSLMPGFELVGGSPPLNYGKAFMGFLLLSQTVTTLPGRQLPKAILPAIYVSVALAIISLILKTPPIEWTFSLSFFSWAFVTLIFCLTAEEALLRGFLQKELFHWVGGGLKGHISSIAVLSLLYPLFHLHWVGDLSLLAPILLTGIALASLYQYYENVETCIFCHFFIRSIGFIAFGGYLS